MLPRRARPSSRPRSRVGIGLFITFIGLVDAGFVREADRTRTGRARHRRLPRRLADARLRRRACSRSSRMMILRVKGAILIGIVGGHGPRDRHRGDRQRRQPDRRHRAQVVNPTGWGLNVPALADTVVDIARLRRCSASSTCSARSSKIGVRRRGAARLHPDARRLLRHDGHDGRHRRRGRPARRGRQPAEHPADPRSSTRSPRSPAAPASVSQQHVVHRVGVRRRRGRPDRAGLASSTGVLFLLATFLAPLVRSCPTRPPRRRWSSSGS